MRTYTLVMKRDDRDNLAHVYRRLGDSNTINPVVARHMSGDEVLIIVHTDKDLGWKLAEWLCEQPLNPPFDVGTLLWYR